MVEFLHRYSNRNDLLMPLLNMLGRIQAGDLSGPTAVQSAPSSPGWLDDRLAAGDRERMTEEYLAGATAAALAERYSISVKSVKRILRERGARKLGDAEHTSP